MVINVKLYVHFLVKFVLRNALTNVAKQNALKNVEKFALYVIMTVKINANTINAQDYAMKCATNLFVMSPVKNN